MREKKDEKFYRVEKVKKVNKDIEKDRHIVEILKTY